MTVNLTKSDFAHVYATYLGHVVGQGQIRPALEMPRSSIYLNTKFLLLRKNLRLLCMAGFTESSVKTLLILQVL